jgi:hypothetical protein
MWRRIDILLTDVRRNVSPPSSSEASVNKISTRRHIPEDGILHSHRCENLTTLSFVP